MLNLCLPVKKNITTCKDLPNKLNHSSYVKNQPRIERKNGIKVKESQNNKSSKVLKWKPRNFQVKLSLTENVNSSNTTNTPLKAINYNLENNASPRYHQKKEKKTPTKSL